jgi:hypothetical protein
MLQKDVARLDRCQKVPHGQLGGHRATPEIRYMPAIIEFPGYNFQNSGGKLSCLTCHDPHERVRRNDATYTGLGVSPAITLQFNHQPRLASL